MLSQDTSLMFSLTKGQTYADYYTALTPDLKEKTEGMFKLSGEFSNHRIQGHTGPPHETCYSMIWK